MELMEQLPLKDLGDGDGGGGAQERKGKERTPH